MLLLWVHGNLEENIHINILLCHKSHYTTKSTRVLKDGTETPEKKQNVHIKSLWRTSKLKKMSPPFILPLSYLLHKGQLVHLFKVSAFFLPPFDRAPPCNKCRRYVVTRPLRIKGLTDCNAGINQPLCAAFVSVRAHLEPQSSVKGPLAPQWTIFCKQTPNWC